MTALPWYDARAVAADCGRSAPRRASELVSLAESCGRTVATDVVALVDLPSFDTVAMDGWAVRGDGPWQIVGRTAAGDQPAAIADGHAVEVATGAMLPPGSSGVVRREDGHRDGAALTGWVSPDVRRAGEQCRAGEVLLGPSEVVTPAAVGLLAASGHDGVTVLSRPRVAVGVLGAELVTAGLPAVGRVRDAIGPLLDGFVAAAGGHLVGVSHVGDDTAATATTIDVDADVVVVTGGTSVGVTDHVHDALAQLGATLVIDGVDVRPGHPMLLAALPRGRWLVGLPGNPLAAVAGTVTLLWPLLDGLHGRPAAPLPRMRLEHEAIRVERGTTLHPAALTPDGLRLLPHAGPAMLRGVAHADALAVLAAGEPGDSLTVPFLLLPRGISRRAGAG